jgi:hypothetical protein
MSVNTEQRITESNINIWVNRTPNPANGAQITFETYNQIMDVLLYNLIDCL